jgi:hypothetical protein
MKKNTKKKEKINLKGIKNEKKKQKKWQKKTAQDFTVDCTVKHWAVLVLEIY